MQEIIHRSDTLQCCGAIGRKQLSSVAAPKVSSVFHTEILQKFGAKDHIF